MKIGLSIKSLSTLSLTVLLSVIFSRRTYPFSQFICSTHIFSTNTSLTLFQVLLLLLYHPVCSYRLTITSQKSLPLLLSQLSMFKIFKRTKLTSAGLHKSSRHTILLFTISWLSLLHIFNHFLPCNTFPISWKQLVILSILKNRNLSLVSSLRSIPLVSSLRSIPSIPSFFSKLLEQIYFKQLNIIFRKVNAISWMIDNPDFTICISKQDVTLFSVILYNLVAT